MYIPSFNRFTNKEEAVDFMQRFNFATIVTVKDGMPVATHLPFLVRYNNGDITLLSHFAKANPQADDISGVKALVIFNEPHAYISPGNYESQQNVPTWNYLAVHAYGNCRLLGDDGDKADLLNQTILNYEGKYLAQWNGLPDDYKSKMMNGIVAFELVVYDLQAKMKLSQNRSEIEKDHIISDLGGNPGTAEQEIAAYMSGLKSK